MKIIVRIGEIIIGAAATLILAFLLLGCAAGESIAKKINGIAGREIFEIPDAIEEEY